MYVVLFKLVLCRLCVVPTVWYFLLLFIFLLFILIFRTERYIYFNSTKPFLFLNVSHDFLILHSNRYALTELFQITCILNIIRLWFNRRVMRSKLRAYLYLLSTFLLKWHSNVLHAINKYIILQICYHIAYLLGYLKIVFTLQWSFEKQHNYTTLIELKFLSMFFLTNI